MKKTIALIISAFAGASIIVGAQSGTIQRAYGGTFTTPLKAPDGVGCTSVPYAFTNAANTGMFRQSGNVDFCVAGTNIGGFTATGFGMFNQAFVFSWSGGATFGIPAGGSPCRVTAQTGAVASVCATTVGGSDASYEVSGQVTATTATSFTFNELVTYTDETNTVRTQNLPFVTIGGSAAYVFNLVNTSGAVYNGLPAQIRAKAGSSITVSTAGTFTTVTYNAQATIKQIG